MRSPPAADSAIWRGSGRQPRTAFTTTRADDGPARTGPHAQPKAVCPRPTTIVRLEGPLHVRAPSSTSTGGGLPTTAQVRGYTHGALEPSSGPIHGTWQGSTGSNRDPGGRCPRRTPSWVELQFLVRHAENVETTCGHRLNPSRGVVTVPDSTASFRRRVCRRKHRISAGQRDVSGCANGRAQTPHTVDDGVDVQRDRRSELTPGRHPKPGWHDNRETV
jgi:hypothetical protein